MQDQKIKELSTAFSFVSIILLGSSIGTKKNMRID